MDIADRLAAMPPERRQYTLQALPAHLFTAGRVEPLRHLLSTFDFLQAKVEAFGAQSLIEDFDLAGRPDLLPVRDALQLSAHILAQDSAQLAAQLLGRLSGTDEPLVEKVLQGARARKAALWLRPLANSLTPPGSPLLRTLTGHTDAVGQLALRPGRPEVFSASYDGTVRWWDWRKGVELAHWRIARVDALAATPDGQYLLWSAGLEVVVWDIANGAPAHTLKGKGPIAISPDGRYVVTRQQLGDGLKVWALPEGGEVSSLTGHRHPVTALAVTPDGRWCVSASEDRTLKVWDLERGVERYTLTGHEAPVSAMAVTPDGRYAVSADHFATFYMWDLERGAVAHSWGGKGGRVWAVAVTPDSQELIAASEDSTLRVWDLENFRQLQTLAGHHHRVGAVVVTPDGRQAISASADCTLKVWNLQAAVPSHRRRQHADPVNVIAVTPDGQRAISGSGQLGGTDNTLMVWEVESGRWRHTLTGHTSWVTALAVSPDGDHVISGSIDMHVKVWDLEGGPPMHDLSAPGQVNFVGLTPDGRYAVAGLNAQTLVAWDWRTGAEFRRLLSSDTRSVSAAAMLPGARQLVFGTRDGVIKVWDLDSGDTLFSLRLHQWPIGALAVAPDRGWAVAAAEEVGLAVFELRRGEMLASLTTEDAKAAKVAITPDGNWIVTASVDRAVRLWNLQGWQLAATLDGHTGDIQALGVSPDGQYVISVAQDQTLRVWDIAAGKLAASFYGESPLRACAMTPDGQTILAGDEAGQVHFLRLAGAAVDRPSG